MREILFRGKTIDNPKRVEGYYAFDGRHWINNKNNGDGFWCAFEINPETLGEFTGIYDKNGVKVFEGDILQFSRSISLGGENLTLELPHQLFLVKWIKGISGFLGISDWSSTEDEVPMGIYSLVWGKGEVIGNIYDNPELLKEGSE